MAHDDAIKKWVDNNVRRSEMSGAARKRAWAKNDWSAGDRIGKLSGPCLRNVRLRAEVDGVADPEVTAQLADILESLLELVGDLADEDHMVVEELPDAIRKIKSEADEAATEHEEELADKDKEIEEQRERVLEMEKEHDAKAAALLTRACDAEDALASATRDGHEIDRESARAVKDAEDNAVACQEIITALRAEIANLRTPMLLVAPAPVRKRRGTRS